MATHRSSLCTEHLRRRWRQTGGSRGGGHRSAPDLLQIRTYLLDLCHIICPHMETVNEEPEKAAKFCLSPSQESDSHRMGPTLTQPLLHYTCPGSARVFDPLYSVEGV